MRVLTWTEGGRGRRCLEAWLGSTLAAPSAALGRVEHDKEVCRPPREWRFLTPLTPAKLGLGSDGLLRSPIRLTTIPHNFEGQLVGPFLESRKAPHGPAANDQHRDRSLFALGMRGRPFLPRSLRRF